MPDFVLGSFRLDEEPVEDVAVGDIEGDIILELHPVSAEKGAAVTLYAVPRGKGLIHAYGESRRTGKDIFKRVQECRDAWDRHIVSLSRPVPAMEGGERNGRPFQEAWNFDQQPVLLKKAAPHLAVAGDRLFTMLFERDGDPELSHLAATLRKLLQEGTRHISITSDSFFLPWGILYTHPIAGEKLSASGSNWRPEGFWGYNHIIEHMPMRRNQLHEQKIDPDEQGIPLSVNLDERISRELSLPCIEEHLEGIKGLKGIKVIRRTLKSELQKAFTDDVTRLERILYFYCHGTGAGSYGQTSLEEATLTLTDDSVSAADIQFWSGETRLPTRPLVFINACQGGQMTTIFYKNFAVELLEQGAIGLIGAQVDIPAVFAAEYASRVFRELFSKGDQVRLGRQLLDTNRALWIAHHNPLGLVYSLYRGVNCFINRPAMQYHGS
jgi:hypothetical protein